MPIYEYRCGEGHLTERIRKYAERDEPLACERCSTPTQRIFSAHHAEPDGIYSYEPNIGSAADFERKRAESQAKAR